MRRALLLLFIVPGLAAGCAKPQDPPQPPAEPEAVTAQPEATSPNDAESVEQSSSPSGVRTGPTGSLDEPTVTGALSAELVRAVGKRHLGQLHRCYQGQLAHHPELGGEVVIRFHIRADGFPRDADIERSTLENSEVTACLKGRVMRMQFPQASGETQVLLPLTFAP